MIGRRDKVLCLIFSIAIIVSLFPLSACDKSINETEAAHSKETSVSSAEPEESDVTETSGTEEEEEQPIEEEEEQPTAEEQSVLLAQRMGIEEKDLKGKYDLFLEFAQTVAENPELNDYRGYVYKIFPVIAGQLNDDNKDYFLDQVRTLTITTNTSEYTGARYDFEKNEAVIGAAFRYYVLGDELDTYIYHELMHFVDHSVDGKFATVAIDKDGNYVDLYTFYVSSDPDLRPIAYGVCEAGAEYFACKYFGFYHRDDIYFTSSEFFTGLEYILGFDEVERLFFDHNSDSAFMEMLSENGFPDEETIDIFNGLNYAVTWTEYYDSYIAPTDTLIRLYENNIGPDYAEDAEFCRILLALSKPPIAETEYEDFIKSVDYDLDIEQKTAVNIIEEQYGDILVEDTIESVNPIMLDGELKLSTVFNILDGDEESLKILIMDYDFDTCNLTDYEFRDVNSPVDPFDKADLDSDECLKILEDLKPDVSDAHNQKVQGSDDILKDVYKKAEDLGNKYGIYFWFADLTPDVITLKRATVVTDADVLCNALDRIESVLALYPDDYFDQLKFEYYDGFAICLYSYWSDYANIDSIYLDGHYYMTIFVDVAKDIDQEYYGADDLRTQYYGDKWAFEAEFFCDIWNLTEKYISNRNDHISTPSVNEDTWEAFNPESFVYSFAEHDENWGLFDEEEFLGYFLNEECVSFSKTDRILTYEYLMLLTLTGESGIEIDQHCKDKIEELKRAIRCSFVTSDWPDECSWESIDI